ncbi:hypothetical protein [Leptodesmis sp.]
MGIGVWELGIWDWEGAMGKMGEGRGTRGVGDKAMNGDYPLKCYREY